jgi:hypothetical protein
MEFVLKNVSEQKYNNIVSLLKKQNLKMESFLIIDQFTDTGLRITDKKVINKIIKSKIDFINFCFNVKAELPIQESIGKIINTRTKSRISFNDKYLIIDATYIKESDTYEIEIEIDPVLSLCHSSNHILKKCKVYLESFGAYI